MSQRACTRRSGRSYNATLLIILLAFIVLTLNIAAGTAVLDSGQAVIAAAQFVYQYTGSMVYGVCCSTATRLADGRVLRAGGSYSAYAEVYDPQTGGWTATANMNQARENHVAVLLQDGRVLVAGGNLPHSGTEAVLDSAEVYNPVSGTWSWTGSMHFKHTEFAAVLLEDGRVLVTGGFLTGADVKAEIYDPATGEWTVAANMLAGHFMHTATLLADGDVLVVGGVSTLAERYDTDTGTWSAAGNLANLRLDFTAVKLEDGRVLVAGGRWPDSSGTVIYASAEIYDPDTNSWSAAASMSEPRVYHTATLLPNGQVLVTGGRGPDLLYDPGLASTELYDPAVDTWTPAGSLNIARPIHTAILLKNGLVLLAGGHDNSAELGFLMYDNLHFIPVVRKR